MNILPQTHLTARIALAMAIVVASGSALAELSECQSECEDRYKSCISSGRMTEPGCRTELETCRKSCNKKSSQQSSD